MTTNPIMGVVIFATFWCSEDIEKQLAKKKSNVSNNEVSKFLGQNLKKKR